MPSTFYRRYTFKDERNSYQYHTISNFSQVWFLFLCPLLDKVRSRPYISQLLLIRPRMIHLPKIKGPWLDMAIKKYVIWNRPSATSELRSYRRICWWISPIGPRKYSQPSHGNTIIQWRKYLWPFNGSNICLSLVLRKFW